MTTIDFGHLCRRKPPTGPPKDIFIEVRRSLVFKSTSI